MLWSASNCHDLLHLLSPLCRLSPPVSPCQVHFCQVNRSILNTAFSFMTFGRRYGSATSREIMFTRGCGSMGFCGAYQPPCTGETNATAYSAPPFAPQVQRKYGTATAFSVHFRSTVWLGSMSYAIIIMRHPVGSGRVPGRLVAARTWCHTKKSRSSPVVTMCGTNDSNCINPWEETMWRARSENVRCEDHLVHEYIRTR